MTMTGKQDRNNVPGPTGEHNTAEPSDVGPIPMAAATAAGMSFMDEGAVFFNSPAGAGPHNIGPPGNMWEWDSGLAITDVEGGGSD